MEVIYVGIIYILILVLEWNIIATVAIIFLSKFDLHVFKVLRDPGSINLNFIHIIIANQIYEVGVLLTQYRILLFLRFSPLFGNDVVSV